jgi:hypothetical protein
VTMDRKLAAELKLAGFPVGPYRAGHKFYPHENDAGWTDAAGRQGVMLHQYDLENRLQDIRNGYYCPSLSDLIEACGDRFARLYVIKTVWTAESDSPQKTAMGDSPEEAVGRLWLALHQVKAPEVENQASAGR